VPRLCEVYPGICLTTEEKARKTSVRVAGECQLARWQHNIQNRVYITIRIPFINGKYVQFNTVELTNSLLGTESFLRSLNVLS